MRKIEQQLQDAIRTGRNWAGGNTTVTQRPSDVPGRTLVEVSLHGNHIATLHTDTMFLRINRETFRNWPTRTTASRLHALSLISSNRPRINIIKRAACIDGVPA